MKRWILDMELSNALVLVAAVLVVLIKLARSVTS
jgi:hypothetical protein